MAVNPLDPPIDLAFFDAGTERLSEIWRRYFKTRLTGTQISHASVLRVFADSPVVVLASDETIRANAIGGALTITLPVPLAGRRVTVKKIDASGNAVTLNAGAVTIDGAGTLVLAAQWNYATVEGDGSNWLVVT
jgi:hypothetical protein